jgi:hypothetical protein
VSTVDDGDGPDNRRIALLEEEVERLRRALVLAKRWLDAFADPFSVVWQREGRRPYEIALDALKAVTMEETRRDGPRMSEDGFPLGTGRIPELSRDRSGYVAARQHMARQALADGQIAAARAALRPLKSTDFSGHEQVVEALLAVVRDSGSTDQEVSDAASRLLRLTRTR